jgi:hypothetical protein
LQLNFNISSTITRLNSHSLRKSTHYVKIFPKQENSSLKKRTNVCTNVPFQNPYRVYDVYKSMNHCSHLNWFRKKREVVQPLSTLATLRSGLLRQPIRWALVGVSRLACVSELVREHACRCFTRRSASRALPDACFCLFSVLSTRHYHAVLDASPATRDTRRINFSAPKF